MIRIFFLIFFAAKAVVAKPLDYDPLVVTEGELESGVFEVNDAGRDRSIGVRVYFPEEKKAEPVILFSHGLGGSRDNNGYLGNHWAGRGYVVVFMQHSGSDERVWKEVLPSRRIAALKEAASAKSFLDRAKDVPVVIDAMEKWNEEAGHVLRGRMELKSLGMSGHSFGAVTTQAVAGQAFGGGRISFTEKRIDAALMMSPSEPRRGDSAAGFAEIRIPCLLMTGTFDDSPIGEMTPESRLKVFPNLINAPAWQVVFDKATHMSFDDRDLAGKEQKGDRYHRAILALSTAFWDAHLKGDEAARNWLNGEGAGKVLVAEDKWEMNGWAK